MIHVHALNVTYVQVNDAGDDETLRSCCLNEVDLIIDAGYSKPTTALTMLEKGDLVKALKLHYTLLKSLAEINQLKKGLTVHGVGEAMVNYPELMRPVFTVYGTEALTAGKLNNICTTSIVHF